MSEIVTTVIFVSLALIVIGIVWAVISGLIQRDSSDVASNEACLKVDIIPTAANCAENICSVTLHRKAGGRVIDGVKITFKDATGNSGSVITKKINLEPLATKTLTDIDSGTTGSVSKVEISAYILDSNGDEYICSQPKTFSVRVSECIPDCSCAENLCVGNTCSDSVCGTTCQGIKPSLFCDGSLISWWRMDDVSGTTLLDNTGTNDGVITGAIQTYAGQVGKAMSFDGVDDYVQIASADSINFNQQDFTILAWVKTSSVTNQNVVTKYKDSNGRQYGMSVLADGSMYVESRRSDLELACNFNSGSGFNDGNWHLIAWSNDDTGSGTNCYGYKDGVQIVSDSRNVRITSSTEPVRIGTNGDNTNKFNGFIDEVMIFNRALSADEVRTLYDSQK